MKRAHLALWLAVLGVPLAFAQSDVLQGIDNVSAERVRIEAARTRESAVFAEQEAACYQRFAVNSCLSKVQSQRRATLADLKRQEQVLNDAERVQRGAAQLRLSEEKAQEKLQKDAEAAQTDNAAVLAERQREQAAKRADHAAIPQDASSAPRIKAPAVPVDSAKAKADYERRLEDAARRKQEAEKRQQEKAGSKPLKPLPVPP